jgi:hypothetical protein
VLLSRVSARALARDACCVRHQMRGRLTSCSESDTFFSGMRCMPAAAQPTEAARTIADFMMAADERLV